MNFNELAAVFPALAEAGVSIELESSPGRGKSSFVEQMVRKLSARDNEEWGFAVAFLATYIPVDLMGMPFKGEKTIDGETFTVTDLAMPPWFITRSGKPISHYKRGILLLDEYGQGEPDVKRASADLLLNKRLGPWIVPEGWIVVAASNKASDRSGVTKSFDFVINRRMAISISDDIESWLSWADENDIHPIIKTFTRDNTDIVFAPGVPKEQGPWCTPRSIVMAGRILCQLAKSKGTDLLPTDSIANELVAGMIGPAAGAQLQATIMLQHEMPAYEDIIAKPNEVKVPEKPDAQMLVCYTLASRVTAKDAVPVLTYVDRMPKDLALTFATAAVKRDPKLTASPGFLKWIGKNAALIAVIGAGKN